MTFDLERCLKEDGGKCRTRDGRDARYLGPVAKDKSAFAVMNANGEEGVVVFAADGRVLRWAEHSCDLLNLPRKLKCWVVMWRGQCGANKAEGWEREADANDRAGILRLEGRKPVIVPVEADEPT